MTPPNDGETPHAFAARYWTYVQEEPDVAIAHAEVKRALSALPATAKRERAHLWEHRERLRDVAGEQDGPGPRSRS